MRQSEAIASAQSYNFATAQELQVHYALTERRGINPIAYAVSGDATTIGKDAA